MNHLERHDFYRLRATADHTLTVGVLCCIASAVLAFIGISARAPLPLLLAVPMLGIGIGLSLASKYLWEQRAWAALVTIVLVSLLLVPLFFVLLLCIGGLLYGGFFAIVILVPWVIIPLFAGVNLLRETFDCLRMIRSSPGSDRRGFQPILLKKSDE
jgi:hypothetical protein